MCGASRDAAIWHHSNQELATSPGSSEYKKRATPYREPSLSRHVATFYLGSKPAQFLQLSRLMIFPSIEDPQLRTLLTSQALPPPAF